MPNRSQTSVGTMLALGFIAALLTGCLPSYDNFDTDTQANAESYIRSNIATLSPRSAVLGGRFAVTDITWEDQNTALVTYEDGHISLTGRTDISASGSTVTATRLRLVDDTSSSSTSTSSSSSLTSSAMGMTPRGEGEFCGGIAGFACQDGLRCQLEGNYPDAGGTCVQA